MHETTDYNSIRSLVYLIPSMLLVSAVRIGSAAMLTHPMEGLSGMTLFRSVGGIPLACMLIEFVLSIACYVVLYRLARTSLWIDIASTMFLCSVLTQALSRIVEWVDYRLDPTGATGSGVIAVTEIPAIFILIGVVFLINGMFEILNEIQDKKACKCKGIKTFYLYG